jgi:hypothetical protein
LLLPRALLVGIDKGDLRWGDDGELRWVDEGELRWGSGDELGLALGRD